MNSIFPSSSLLGIRFEDLDQTAALAAIGGRAADAAFAYVVTINADHFVRLDTADDALRADYAAAWLSLCDSRVLRKLAGLRGYDLSVVTGSDLTAAVFEQLITPHTPITIIGSDDATIAALRMRYPGLLLHHHNPPMGFIHQPEAVAAAVEFVCTHPARFVFLCVGSPQQELLASRIAATGRARGVGLCVGASITFLAGTKQRAPLWMQRAHIEWLHRLLQEPGRMWRRYLLGALPLLSLIRRMPPASSARS